jgi:hypothetical protein
MKLLRISNNVGEYFAESGEYHVIDKITKEDLMRLADAVLTKDVEFDAYDENAIKNQAHQIVYKSVLEKLSSLSGRKQEFVDESQRLFLREYEKYSESSAKEPTGT